MHSENLTNSNDPKSLSAIFAWCGRTIDQLLENTRLAEDKLPGAAQMQAFNNLKSQGNKANAKDLDFGPRTKSKAKD